jgi:hypothetical protein
MVSVGVPPKGKSAVVVVAEEQDAPSELHTTCSWEGWGIGREAQTAQRLTTFRNASTGNWPLLASNRVEEVVSEHPSLEYELGPAAVPACAPRARLLHHGAREPAALNEPQPVLPNHETKRGRNVERV